MLSCRFNYPVYIIIFLGGYYEKSYSLLFDVRKHRICCKILWGGKSAVMGETPELEEYEFDSSKYDYIIFGTPVWASSITPPIRSFIKENIEELKDKKIGLFICFMGGGADKAKEKFKECVGINELNAELILIDPKDKKTDEKDSKIEEFCETINRG